jgi:hypothetical protein
MGYYAKIANVVHSLHSGLDFKGANVARIKASPDRSLKQSNKDLSGLKRKIPGNRRYEKSRKFSFRSWEGNKEAPRSTQGLR